MIKMSIKNRLIIAFLAVLIIPCASIGWFSYQKAKDEITTQIMESANQSVDFMNNQVTDRISTSMADVDYLGKTVTGNMVDGGANSQLKKVLDPLKAVKAQLDNVYFGTNTGEMLLSPEKKMEDGLDPRKREWYTKAMENKGKTVVNNPTITADGTGNVMVSISKTTDDGSGVIGGNLSLANIAQQMKKIKVGQKGYVFILDKDRKYLAHPTSKPGEERKDPTTAQMYASDEGTIDYTLNGQQKRAIFVTNKVTGWKIIGTIEMSEVAAASQGILHTTITVIAVAVLIGILLVIWIVRSITVPLTRIMSTTDQIASGDLTNEIDIHSKDELGQLSSSVNRMVHNLRDLIGGVISSSQNVAAASQQISATTEEIAGGSSAQAHAAQQMQERFNELSAAVNSVAESAEEAVELAGKTSSIAQDGGQIVQKSLDSMNRVSTQMTRLEEDSGKIGEIIEVIDDIAEQTNLLALNAAIEAARAGEQGRGFAVVADEVRKLAERSGEATKQITAIIKGMQQNTHTSVLAVTDSVSQSQETGSAFEQIISMIKETEHKVSDIAAASEEQAAQTSEVLHSIESISSASQEAAAASEETAATSQSLAQLAEGLNSSVSIFKIK